ncbi:MAG: MATE family efflux transporter [Clostridia bacterium]|nr:MATE family efflux transporter [Clostridia bacterium]
MNPGTVRENRITEGVIWKEMLRYAIPLMVGNLFQQLYNTVDSIVVGRFVGTNALAAVSSVMFVILMIIGFVMGLANGASVLMSQRYGARDAEGTQKTIHTAFTAMFFGGILIAVVGVLLSPAILRLIHTPAEVLPDATLYLRIYFLGGPVLILYNVGASMLQAVGDSRRPLRILITSCIFNIILDVLLVVVFSLGVAGVAIATLAAQALSAFLAIRALMSDDDIYRVDPRKLGIDVPTLRRIVGIGLPAGIQQTIISLSNMIVQGYVNGFGAAAVAGIGAYNKIDAFVIMPVMSLNLAATTFVGQNLGAGRQDRVKTTVKTVFGLGQVITITLSVILGFGCRYVLGLFTKDEQAVSYGLLYMSYLVPYYFILALFQNAAAIIRGAGETFVPMVILISGNCVFRILYLVIANHIAPTIDVTLACYPVTWVATGAAMLLFLWKGNWLRKFQREAQRQA